MVVLLTQTCEFCRGQFQRPYKQRFCGRGCKGKAFSGPNHPTYKGRVEGTNGYIKVWQPGHPLAYRDGYVLEHRFVLYEAGIEIPCGYHVHHLNHDKGDNRLENLAVLSPDEHRTVHPGNDGLYVNQFGVWERSTPEAVKASRKAYMKRWRQENKQHIQTYKQARKEAGLPY